jgi:hypothetical protein
MTKRRAHFGVAGLLVAVGTLLGAAGPAAANHSVLEQLTVPQPGGSGVGAEEYGREQISADGRHVMFWTTQRLTTDDPNYQTDDLYMRFNGTTTLVSKGTLVPPGYAQLSSDGNVIDFSADQRATPDDTDSTTDVFQWVNGTLTKMSTGPMGGNGPYAATKVGMSADASHVAFQTTEQLTPDDLDNSVDYYVRSGNTTELITKGSSGGNSGAAPRRFIAFSADGSKAFFETAESLVPADTDSSVDLYEYSSGTTSLVSTGPSGGNGPVDVGFVSIAPAGNNVFFGTNESLVPADTDGRWDVYARSGSTTTLVSAGATGGNGPYDAFTIGQAGSRNRAEAFYGVTDDGQSVFFSTPESLLPADTNNAVDTYEWSGGNLSLATPAGPSSGFVQRFSSDGTNVVFATQNALVPQDTNGETDIYVRYGAVTELVSGPPVMPPSQPCDGDTIECPFVMAISDDASHIFFYSPYELVPGARNGGVYEYHDGHLFLIPGLRIFAYPLSSADGSRLIYPSNTHLLSTSVSGMELYSISEPTGYPRPKGASPAQFFLVPAFQPCGASNSSHGGPLSFPSCAPPSQVSGQLTVGTPDSNGQPAKAIGKVVYTVHPGDPSTPADDADVAVDVKVSDVRKRADLSDYQGELSLVTATRITDKDNTPDPSGAGPATVQDASLAVTVPCSATADSTVGATCATSTTVDAVVPGMVKEGRRSTWELGRLSLYDGGPDGIASTTGDNTLFMTQGVFVP